MKCIIIDDEPLAHRIIEKYSENLPNIEIIAKFYNAIDAFDILITNAVDLIFLDINLPKISGMSFLKSLKRPPLVIITTAYREYASEGFDLDVVDYLVKPFPLERFLKAVNKAYSIINKIPENPEKSEDSSNAEETLFVKSEKRFYQIKKRDILYLEAVGDYVKIHSTDDSYIVHSTFKNLLAQLASNEFIQIHKSFIVNKQKIEYIEGNRIFLKEIELPIGLVYKENILNQINMK
jgi:DNA-binding LytR/AlgR family response regulator